MNPGANSVPTTGMRVRLRPSRRADIVDIALAGKLAEVDGVEHGADGRVYVAVSLVGDTAVDLGPMSQLGHRFFFAPEELEILSGGIARRILVAGVGDIFRPGGCGPRAVVEALRGRNLPPGVRVADFGVRRHDLLRTLEDYEGAVLLRAGTIGDLRSGGLADLPRIVPWAAQLQPTAAHRCEQIIVIGCGDADSAEPEGTMWTIDVALSAVNELVADSAVEEGKANEG